MSRFKINDIVKCVCNEGVEELLIEGEYYVIRKTHSNTTGRNNIKVTLLGSDVLDDIYYHSVRFDKADTFNKEDVIAISNRQIDEGNPHYKIATSFIEEAHNIVVDKLNATSTNNSSISQNLLQVLEQILENTSEENILVNLYPLLPLSEIKLGARYKHIITGKEYYVVQDVNHNTHLRGMNYYLLIDADTHQSANRLQESEYSMRLLIRSMGLQLAE